MSMPATVSPMAINQCTLFRSATLTNRSIDTAPVPRKYYFRPCSHIATSEGSIDNFIRSPSAAWTGWLGSTKKIIFATLPLVFLHACMVPRCMRSSPFLTERDSPLSSRHVTEPKEISAFEIASGVHVGARER